MDDLISRQAAIEAIDSFNVFESRSDQIKLEQMIGELPPVQPERIKGRWTRDNACSECGCQPWFSGDIHNYNFCPHCGADMREVTT